MHPREAKDNDLFLTKSEAFAIDDERRRLIEENAKLRGQLQKLDRELSLIKFEDSDAFDRTASHMAGEYVSYKPELTDEEINQLAEEHLDMDWQTGVIEFARAILRKAQEK